MSKTDFYEESQLKMEFQHWLVSMILAGGIVLLVIWAAVQIGVLKISLSPTSSTHQYQSLSNDEKLKPAVTPVFPTNSNDGFQVNDKSIHQLGNLLSSFEGSVGVFVSSADFVHNTYTHVYSSAVRSADDHQASYPLISDSTVSNDRIFNILLGNVDCTAAEELAAYDSNGLNGAEWVCTVAIPPYAHIGKSFFGGFLTVTFLNRLSEDREKVFISEIKRVARFIYEEDIQNVT